MSILRHSIVEVLIFEEGRFATQRRLPDMSKTDKRSKGKGAHGSSYPYGYVYAPSFSASVYLVSSHPRLPGYYNPILAYGEQKAIQDAFEAGANGFIVVDLPPEEAVSFR